MYSSNDNGVSCTPYIRTSATVNGMHTHFPVMIESKLLSDVMLLIRVYVYISG